MEETRSVFQPDYPDEDLTDSVIIDLLQNLDGVFEVVYPDLMYDEQRESPNRR
jgi:hypothetical protein